jgi:hypothetical protein
MYIGECQGGLEETPIISIFWANSCIRFRRVRFFVDNIGKRYKFPSFKRENRKKDYELLQD